MKKFQTKKIFKAAAALFFALIQTIPLQASSTSPVLLDNGRTQNQPATDPKNTGPANTAQVPSGSLAETGPLSAAQSRYTSPDGRTDVYESNGKIYVQNTVDPAKKYVISNEGPLEDVSFTAHNQVVINNYTFDGRVIDLKTYQPYDYHLDPNHQVVTSPNGRYSIKDERPTGRLLIADKTINKSEQLVFFVDEGPVTQYMATDDGIFYVTEHDEKPVRKFVSYADIFTKKVQIPTINGQTVPREFRKIIGANAISPDGKTAVVQDGQRIIVQDLNNPQRKYVLTEGPLEDLSFTAHNQVVINNYTFDGRVIDLNTFQPYDYHLDPNHQVVTSPNGRYSIKDERPTGRLLIADKTSNKSEQLVFFVDEAPVTEFMATDEGIFYVTNRGEKPVRKFVSYADIFTKKVQIPTINGPTVPKEYRKILGTNVTSPDGKAVVYELGANIYVQSLIDPAKKFVISGQGKLEAMSFTKHNQVVINTLTFDGNVIDLNTFKPYDYRIQNQVVLSPNGRYSIKDERPTGRLLIADKTNSSSAQLVFFVDEGPVIKFTATNDGIIYVTMHDEKPVQKFASYADIFKKQVQIPTINGPTVPEKYRKIIGFGIPNDTSDRDVKKKTRRK